MNTMQIPKDLINENPSPAKIKPEILKDYSVETLECTLHELLELKTVYPAKILEESKKITSIKHITWDEVNSFMKTIEALNWNLVIIKELLSVVNTPIYTDMYTKSAHEGIKVTLNKLIAKTTSKTKKTLHDKLTSLKKDKHLQCITLDERMQKYNSNGKVTLELLKI